MIPKVVLLVQSTDTALKCVVEFSASYQILSVVVLRCVVAEVGLAVIGGLHALIVVGVRKVAIYGFHVMFLSMVMLVKPNRDVDVDTLAAATGTGLLKGLVRHCTVVTALVLLVLLALHAEHPLSGVIALVHSVFVVAALVFHGLVVHFQWLIIGRVI